MNHPFVHLHNARDRMGECLIITTITTKNTNTQIQYMNTDPHQHLSMHVVLRLMEMSPESMTAVIQSYQQLCDIEERHMAHMLSLTAQQKNETKMSTSFVDQHWAISILLHLS